MKDKLTLTHACSRYGADMGRGDTLPEDPNAPCKLHLQRLALTDGGCYDAGGAYWGCGSEETGGMWCAWNADGVRIFTRRRSRAEAKAYVLGKVPGAKFYR